MLNSSTIASANFQFGQFGSSGKLGAFIEKTEKRKQRVNG